MRLRWCCFILLLVAFTSGFVLYTAPSFAATTITAWDDAKAQYPGSTAGNVNDSAGGIVWSRHNLSAYGWPFQSAFSFDAYGSPVVSKGTTEICVFCHTPHFGTTGTAPLWNRGSSASAYIAYGTTIGGTNINTVGGSSLACLSCHDGVTTFDNLINQPGKGSNTNGAGTDAGIYFYMGNPGDLPAYPPRDHFGILTTPAGCTGACHSQEEANRLNIGMGPGYDYANKIVSLSNDHPINVYYNADDTNSSSVTIAPGNVGKASLRPTTTTINSITVDNARLNPSSATADFGLSTNLWAVKGFISNTATIADLLRDGGKVQCTSCHDPHYKNQTNNELVVINSYNRPGGVGDPYAYTVSGQYDKIIDGLFLRRVGGNSNSGVCRTCHNK